MLNSGEGQLVQFTPPRVDEGPEAPGRAWQILAVSVIDAHFAPSFLELYDIL